MAWNKIKTHKITVCWQQLAGWQLLGFGHRPLKNREHGSLKYFFFNFKTVWNILIHVAYVHNPGPDIFEPPTLRTDLQNVEELFLRLHFNNSCFDRVEVTCRKKFKNLTSFKLSADLSASIVLSSLLLLATEFHRLTFYVTPVTQQNRKRANTWTDCYLPQLDVRISEAKLNP